MNAVGRAAAGQTKLTQREGTGGGGKGGVGAWVFGAAVAAEAATPAGPKNNVAL